MQQQRLALKPILEGWVAGEPISESVQQQLKAWELADRSRSRAFGIIPENVSEAIADRIQLFQGLKGQFDRLPISSSPVFLETLWNLWLPMALQLADCRKQLDRPLVQGVLGGQGTGKTTLATTLTWVLGELGYRTIGISIDDLYKTYADRQQLKKEDPRLIRRGPPGTHDIDLGIAVLDGLRQPSPPEAIAIPRFDKSLHGGEGDRSDPDLIEGADLILFEGWFVGVRPVDAAAFDRPPDPIVTEADIAFARHMNGKLQDYLPLWQKLDRLMVLNPVDYRLSQQWRLQAEHQMIASGKSGMSDSEIEEFVKYFWKSLHPELFIKPLLHQPNLVNLVISINGDRSLGQVYQPVSIQS